MDCSSVGLDRRNAAMAREAVIVRAVLVLRACMTLRGCSTTAWYCSNVSSYLKYKYFWCIRLKVSDETATQYN